MGGGGTTVSIWICAAKKALLSWIMRNGLVWYDPYSTAVRVYIPTHPLLLPEAVESRPEDSLCLLLCICNNHYHSVGVTYLRLGS